MGIMLQRSLREPVAKIIEPITKFLVKRRISANWISVIGGLGSTTSALYFFSNGKFFVGVLAVTFFVLFDLFDGAVARASSVGISKWGAVLDSTLDRISDAAIYIGVLLFYIPKNDPIVTLIIVAATSSYLVSYIRARAESLDIVCEGGIAERSERLIIVLITCGLHGLGVDYVMAFGIWLVTLLSVITILQRVLIVYKAVK
jgi:CDP-diacylglycerol--glycerol-3-phosphate 3-phosphatidyltransferase